MKHRIYSISILALGLFVLAACSSEPMPLAPVMEDQGQAQTYAVVETPEPGRGISYPINIGAESDAQVGYLIVSNDAQNLYLTYTMIGPWRLKDSYIHVGRAQDDVPVDEAGRPILERFRYGFDLDRGMVSHVHRIALSEIGAVPGQDIVIGSFASVYRDEIVSDNVSREPRGQSWWFMADYRVRRPGSGTIITDDILEISKEIKVEY